MARQTAVVEHYYGAEPVFAVLDWVGVVEIPGSAAVVTEVRRYTDGHYEYRIGRLEASDDGVDGLYPASELHPLHRRLAIQQCWSGPLWRRDVVRVAGTYPKPKWRGLFGEVVDELEPGRRYLVDFADPRIDKHRHRSIAAEHLEPVGYRLPPPPVPRPVVTWRAGRDQQNLRPVHEFDVVDELDQYL